MADHVLIAKWDKWLDAIKQQVIGLHGEAHVFWAVQDIIRSNPKLHKSNVFYELLTNSYASSTASGIRRLVDRDKKVISLRRLPEDIWQNTSAITRQWYVDLYTSAGLPADIGHKTFDRYAGKKGATVAPAIIAKDLSRLKNSPEVVRVKKFVNKRIAHFDRRPYRTAPTFSDLRICLRLMEAVLRRYLILVRAEGLITATPVIQYDWKEIFRTPWIP